MKKIFIALLILSSFSAVAIATEMEMEIDMITADTPVITKIPYAFATASNAKTGAVFLTITNPSSNPDSLIEAHSDVAEFVEIHQNYIDPDDGMMMMRKINKINIDPKSKTVLEPTGYHIMLINLKAPLIKEQIFPITLVFESGHKIEADVIIVPPGLNPDINNHDVPHVHPDEKPIDFSNTFLKAQ